jgi:hypothetical protein
MSNPQLGGLVSFDECSWSMAPRGTAVVGTGVRRHFSIHVARRDDQGMLKKFTLRDREAYGIDARALDDSATGVFWK